MNINQLLQKPLLSISSGKKYVITNNIVVDKKITKITYLTAKEDNKIFYLNTKRILSTGKNAITIHSDNILIPENNFELKTNEFIINTKSEIYTYLGDFVASLNNITTDKFNIVSLSLINKEKEVTKILSAGENIIIVDDTEKTYHKPRTDLKNIPVKIC